MSTSESQTPEWVKSLAIISGVLGFILFVITPFMPVTQTQSTLNWPQDGKINSVSAPLISYAPDGIEATVPLTVVDKLREGQTTVLSTLPSDSKDATSRGLFVRYSDAGLDVLTRDKVPFSISKSDLEKLDPQAVLKISATKDSTKAEIPGTKYKGETDDDERPQVTGIYTELENSPELIDAGLAVKVDINSRFTSTPSIWKYTTMFGGLILLLISLWTLWRQDRNYGHQLPFLPAGWFSFRPLDALVGAILTYWYLIGANTSDDGYLLTMGRASAESGYMANYYRWFGVPESPFGAPYYDLLGLMARISTASIWMRLPGFIAGILIWMILSREVLPRLGEGINSRRVAHWASAFAFLSFWLVYNNGLRPEPVIALGALLTWVSIERAIAMQRLLPGAIGVIIATVSLGAGPTGLMAVSALLVGLSGLVRIVVRRAKTKRDIFAMCAPFLASGTAILLAVFGDQTLATVIESIRVRSAKGPSLHWYDEWVRYETLLQQNVDGSFTRRFAVIMMFVGVAIVVAAMLRHGRVPGSDPDPSRRLLLVIFGTMFFMMFTPTKWSHHFGVYAGIGAAIAGLGAVALAHQLSKSKRLRVLTAGGVLFITANTLAGTNGWWYVSSFGVPWYDKTIQLKNIEANTVILVLSLLVLAAGTYLSFIDDIRKTAAGGEIKQERRKTHGVLNAPVMVMTALVVLFSIASLTKGFISQYPAYTVGLGNLRTFTGDHCALASDVMVENNTNESFLTPANGSALGDSLITSEESNFKSNNIPVYISTEGVSTSGTSAGSIAGSTEENETGSGEGAGQSAGITGGVRPDTGINGSRAELPYNLDYKTIPVVGSYTVGAQFPASTKTTWYSLPERKADAPILVISAAGRIKHDDINGVEQDGQKLVVEYGRTKNGNGDDIEKLGTIEPYDIGPSPSWRNLRVPLDSLPPEADVVRIVASDSSLDTDQWLAFTPPRVPSLTRMTNVIEPETPGLLDWSVALQFPCQRTFYHYAGVTELPEYRISPDHPGKVTLSPWQDFNGGGIMGVSEATSKSLEVPTYLNNDWQRDWGSLETYSLRTNSVGEEPVPAKIDYQTHTRSGLWSPGKMQINQ
ncbi:arabinosyltransferase domain-containing protein [Corynebacterium freiburgense]|uniref:arabinosyltransferase domain-containing protein n=1 Tax=Corynebacterium freiburgense TaxID=556548 RepID=UPI00054F9D13|nr:arabinosyltransferase domain-containing protein [Corynebacterium freiburgense]